MARTQRLLALMQALRRRRRPVAARELAAELGVTIRTIYRDVATLQAEGALIEGEAGFGYVLREGFFLPPLMFDEDELDALLLGLRLVQVRADADLGRSASDALATLVAVLPEPLAEASGTSGLLAGPAGEPSPHVLLLRQAIRAETKIRIAYTDGEGRETHRVVWPIAVAFFEKSEVLAGWCEMRRGFRHFRLDRIATIERLGDRLPRRHRVLLAEWRATITGGD